MAFKPEGSSPIPGFPGLGCLEAFLEVFFQVPTCSCSGFLLLSSLGALNLSYWLCLWMNAPMHCGVSKHVIFIVR